MSGFHETENDPTWAETITALARRAIYEGDGPMLAELQSYDATAQTAVVRPLFHVWRGTEFRRVPPFTVNVGWPRGSAFAATFPLAPGVLVQLVVQSTDHSPLESGTRDGEPPDGRRNQITDAIAYPMASNPASPLPAAAVANDGYVIWATPFVYLGGSDATDFVALASKVASELSTIAGLYNSHVHPETGGVTGPPGPPPTGLPPHNYSPGSVASAVVKSL